MASGIIGNDVPRKGLRVRVPCPPLLTFRYSLLSRRFCTTSRPHASFLYHGYRPLSQSRSLSLADSSSLRSLPNSLDTKTQSGSGVPF